MRNLYLIAALLFCGALSAQSVGKVLPALELSDMTNTKAKNLSDYSGRAMLLEFFSYTWGPCGTAVPHLNEIAEAMGSKGLSVIGVTSAGKGPTSKWIAKHGAKYAYGYDTSRGLSKFLGIRGIPNAVLVSATGKIVWQGHPSGLTLKIIAPHLKGAVSRPMWDWPTSASSVATSLKKGSIGKAKKAAETLSQKGDSFGDELVSCIDAIIEGKVNAIEADFAAGRFLQVSEAAKQAKKSLAGLPAAKTIKEIIDRMKADRSSKKTIAMQRRLRKLTAEAPRTPREAQKLIAELKKLQRRAAGTIAAKEAGAAITSIEALARRSR